MKFVEAIIKKLEDWGVNSAVLIAFLGVGLIIYLFLQVDFSANRTFSFVFLSSPIWLPIVLFLVFFDAWKDYVFLYFTTDQGRVSLEVLIPQEIFKSPLAMEAVLTQLYQTASPDNHIQTYWDGKNPQFTSLELVSTGGQVRFIINAARKKNKHILETHLYAQYPGIEIRELPLDYTAEIPWDLSRYSYFSLHFYKNPKIMAGHPIKTYVDYGLDKDPKEEFKIDPITTMLELLGSIGPGEHMWYQFLIKAHREETFQTGSLFKKPDWKGDIDKEINTIAHREEKTNTDVALDVRLTPGEKDAIVALERSKGKYPFKTYIRTMYIAENDVFQPGERIGAIITSLFNFNDQSRNSFKMAWRTDFNWNWWQDPTGKKKLAWKKRELYEYKRRAFVPKKPEDTGSIMTTEELATMYHFPGQVARTPTLTHIPSKRGEAPSNLPTL